MRLALEIKLDNAAFGDAPNRADGEEVGRILGDLAYHLTGPIDLGDSGDLRDINGNVCGRYRVFEN